jgi:hypothetical protein
MRLVCKKCLSPCDYQYGKWWVCRVCKRWLAFWAVLLLVLLPQRAIAQEPVFAKYLYFSTAAGDEATTYVLLELRDGFREANPVYRWIPNNRALVAVAAAQDIGAYFLLKRVLAKDHPRLFKYALIGASIGRGFVVAHNLKLVHQSRP